MKTLIKLALLALVVILGYNYFYGDEREQAQAERIVGKVKDLGSDIKALVVSEKEKYDEGKYDKTVDKFSELINSVKEKISNIDLEKLEEKQQDIKKAVEELKEDSSDNNSQKEAKIKSEIQDLYDDISKVIEKIDINKE
ncbi:hypothetical protein [Portibacter lacus]|uniref:Uncharacterized protein n=1 Tax=Portibacter lacus TaxID=1099794 RepID=A0AA37WGM9_9BACT|nr:hypothetical protein [Portibacter lacus]GLR20068.1 hypothetical protein GCM10007940_46840 [Portibacter lacus]